ncbi:MAG: alpha/beta fold hydrolase, partial [Clostridia bacterium]|nr:alpha/beta fold hydrolase [Clostridia bacterium]
LAYVTAKTLIIWGKNDKATPLYMAKRYRRKLRFSRLVVLKDAGHFSYLDKKGETLALIRAYISDDDSDSVDIF